MNFQMVGFEGAAAVWRLGWVGSAVREALLMVLVFCPGHILVVSAAEEVAEKLARGVLEPIHQVIDLFP